MAHSENSSLIPAKAGTQMANSEAGPMSAAAFQPTSTSGDLGPGFRRDERNEGCF